MRTYGSARGDRGNPVPYRDESGREHVQQHAADELGGRQRHGLAAGGTVAAVVGVAKAHGAVGEAAQALVADGDPVGVAAEVVEDLFGTGERRNRNGEEAIRWLVRLPPTCYEVVGWEPPDENGHQKMVAEQWMRAEVVDRGRVLAIYRGRPSVERPPFLTPDWPADGVTIP